jgi:hypothetical protein
MRCPQCLQPVKEPIKHCQCGFAFDDVASVDLQDWFAEVKQALETAYIAAPTAWQQSGKSGTFEDWIRLRIANIAPVKRSGTYLAIFGWWACLAGLHHRGADQAPMGVTFARGKANPA